MSALLDPAVLFFAVGLVAGLLRSDLEVPAPVARFLSLYLLMALGLKGGFALSAQGLPAQGLAAIGLALLLATGVPLAGWWLLRRVVAPADALGLAAAYGSVSAVTFVTAHQQLEQAGLAPGGYMTAAMVLMESPALLIALMLRQRLAAASASPTLAWAGTPPGAGAGVATLAGPPTGGGAPWWRTLREACTHGPQLLLLGALAIGVVSGATGQAVMKPFTGDLFKGLLAFFLLDMGVQVARQLATARRASPWLLAYAVLGPLVHAALALGLAWLAGLGPGDGALLMVLAASASYIVVPAALRQAVPEANPALYLGLPLGVTFPLNLLAGIGLYTAAAQAVLQA
ncbi:sodium-dependent bicarbonate transport family permease [Ideonella livida]|uniref:Sodium-dependent bicarbonate transport family permease n=1 Tax=Ideonella livida TaxID=2707176 RepID=A0A7C9TKM1_9BURK|nr:sodium-dependent bicarbonate transport family permease [Ideonella livida]NDY92821.1 sodium-dependent bicarbonate transport family permease [Ideonella livida]